MSTVEQVMRLLIEHPSIPVYPPTLPMSYRCPACPEADVDGPNSPSHAEHQAHELHKAGLLRPDIEDDFGLSKVELQFAVDKPTHVHIERRGVPIVHGYIEGPRRAVVHPITATTEGTCPGGC